MAQLKKQAHESKISTICLLSPVFVHIFRLSQKGSRWPLSSTLGCAVGHLVTLLARI